MSAPLTPERCWVVRTDRNILEQLIAPELKRGVLRQGWGYAEQQDLEFIKRQLDDARQLDQDQAASWRHNRRLLPEQHDGISAGDLLLLPNAPLVGQWTLVRALGTYRFAMAETGDHGHQLDIEVLRSSLSPRSGRVSARLRRTMRCQQALWNIDHLASEVHALLEPDDDDADRPTELGLAGIRAAAKHAAWAAMRETYGAAELEQPVQQLLDSVFDRVERTSGPAEHGADLLGYVEGPLGLTWTVAIQIKMWEGEARSLEPVHQIDEACDHWSVHGALIVTTAERTHPDFDDAVDQLATRRAIPVSVLCRSALLDLALDTIDEHIGGRSDLRRDELRAQPQESHTPEDKEKAHEHRRPNPGDRKCSAPDGERGR